MQRYAFNEMEQLPILQKINLCFERIFPAHLNFLLGDIGRPARSPELLHCDYFPWGYVKAEMYKHRPTTIDRLKATIRQTVNEIPEEITRESDIKL